ncbi:hypothetical protein [Endozoicomonas sp. ALB091]|uniref:hypothetical protein n=1 Tax=Endozoicomonas sp. ALB091 TaxID=3403073 RepID=UPI003BB63526
MSHKDDLNQMDWFMYRLSVRSRIHNAWLMSGYLIIAFVLGYAVHDHTPSSWQFWVLATMVINLCLAVFVSYRHSKIDVADVEKFSQLTRRYMTPPEPNKDHEHLRPKT